MIELERAFTALSSTARNVEAEGTRRRPECKAGAVAAVAWVLPLAQPHAQTRHTLRSAVADGLRRGPEVGANVHDWGSATACAHETASTVEGRVDRATGRDGDDGDITVERSEGWTQQ